MNYTQFGKRWGLSGQRIGQLVKDGRLPLKDRKIDVLKADQVMKFKIARAKEGEEKNLAYWQEKTKHEKAKRQLAELELENKLKTLIPAEVIKNDLEAMYEVFKKRLNVFIEEAGPLIQGQSSIPQIQKTLDGLICKALEDCAGYNPETGKLKN